MTPTSLVGHRRGLAHGRIIIPLASLGMIIAYVAVAGGTGFCPTCAAIVDAVTGRQGAVQTVSRSAVVPEGSAGTIHGLVMTDLEGNDVPLSEFSGRPILIDLWATWCAPCRKVRKVLHGIADEASEHATIISLSVDEGGPEVVKSFMKEHEGGVSPFMELMSTDPAFRALIKPHDRQPTIPKLIYVNASGRIVDIEYGVNRPDWVLSRLKALASAGASG